MCIVLLELFMKLLFTNSNMADCDERVNGRNQCVEEAGVVLPVVEALKMVLCGGR